MKKPSKMTWKEIKQALAENPSDSTAWMNAKEAKDDLYKEIGFFIAGAGMLVTAATLVWYIFSK